jgi:hypothetical protein
MAMPPTPSTQNAVILGSSAKPTAADLGVQGSPPGVVVTGFQTEFPFTHDVYHDRLMNRIVDIGYDWQLVVTCESEILQKLASAEDDHSMARDPMMYFVEATALSMMVEEDTRGFQEIGQAWDVGIFFILTEGGGTFERNKPRKDRLKYEFRFPE